jgi:hypothetical protein
VSFDELIQSGWARHEGETAAVAESLEAGVALVDDPDQALRLIQLSNHAVGHHLGDWPRAARIGEATLGKLRDGATAAVYGNLAVARYLAGDAAGGLAAEGKAAAAAPADALSTLVRTRVFAADAFLAAGRVAEGAAVFRAALAAAATLPPKSPADRAIATVSNNVASALRDLATRTSEQDALMLEAARTARTYWLRVGDWTTDERSDYLLALVSNSLGRYDDGVLHASRGLATIANGGEEPVDAAFLNLALAAAYRGLGLPQEHRRHVDEAKRLAAGFGDAGLTTWFEGELAKT